MPQRLRTRCRHVGCPALTDNKSGYCDKHKSQSAYRTQRTDTEAQRLYRTNRWKEISKAKRAADPFCERCARRGKVTPADLVHHIVPIEDGGDFWDPLNHESVCSSCQATAHRGTPPSNLYKRGLPRADVKMRGSTPYCVGNY